MSVKSMFKLLDFFEFKLKKNHYIILSIVLIFRLFWSSFVDFGVIFNIHDGDAEFYANMAENILSYGIYGNQYVQEYYRAPLYSYFLALIKFIPGFWILNIIITQHLLTISTSILSYKLLENTLPKKIIFYWLFLWVISPVSSLQDSLILQESLYTNLIILTVALSILLSKKDSLIYSIYIGLIIGLTCLTREVYLLLPTFISLAILINKGFSIKSLKFIITIFLTISLTISPWLYRNYKITQGEIFISKGISGLLFYIGTWQPDANWNKEWLRGSNLPPHAFDELSNKEEIKKAMLLGDDQILIKEAKRRLLSKPFSTLKLWIQRSRHMWFGTRSDLVPLSLERFSFKWYIFKIILLSYNFYFVVTGLIGLISCGLKKNLLLIPSSFILYNYLIYMPFLSIETRYSHPSIPWLILFSVILAEKLFRKNLTFKI